MIFSVFVSVGNVISYAEILQYKSQKYVLRNIHSHKEYFCTLFILILLYIKVTFSLLKIQFF